MSKLPSEYKFIDLSDYGRTPARWIALSFKETPITPLHVTSMFIVSGLLAVGFIMWDLYWVAGFFIVLKSILDGADGELSRVKETPSYVGRYYDSIADILLNLALLMAVWSVTHWPLHYVLWAFIGIQLQGTLYNYYYVILRNNTQGDSTSRIFENCPPVAFPEEKQQTVDLFFHLYNGLYIVFDKTIYWMDKGAKDTKRFPSWFMTLISTFGLGFQLLLMAVLLVLSLEEIILPFFIGQSVFIFVFIGIRRLFLS